MDMITVVVDFELNALLSFFMHCIFISELLVPVVLFIAIVDNGWGNENIATFPIIICSFDCQHHEAP